MFRPLSLDRAVQVCSNAGWCQCVVLLQLLGKTLPSHSPSLLPSFRNGYLHANSESNLIKCLGRIYMTLPLYTAGSYGARKSRMLCRRAVTLSCHMWIFPRFQGIFSTKLAFEQAPTGRVWLHRWKCWERTGWEWSGRGGNGVGG